MSATQRVAKSSIDWAAFYQRIPKRQQEFYRTFKAKNDAYVSRVFLNAESLQGFDWAFYKSRVTVPGMVDKFEKAYTGIDIPYPKVPSDLIGKVDAAQKEEAETSKKYIAALQKEIAERKLYITKLDELPPKEERTYEMFFEYFPHQAFNTTYENAHVYPMDNSTLPGVGRNIPHWQRKVCMAMMPKRFAWMKTVPEPPFNPKDYLH